jgi:flagellar biosynthesis/type III secretory pathway M-ring protein FliF/YscJ
MVGTMFCTSCKRENPPDAKYCRHCGEMLHLGGKDAPGRGPSPKKIDQLKARRERRKAIEKIADENPELAAKVLQTWLKSE